MSRDVLSASPALRRFGYRLAFVLGRWLPMPLGRLLAYACAQMSWLIDERGRAVVRRNLAHFLPRACPQALDRAVRRNYVAFWWSLYETFHLTAQDRDWCRPPRLELIDPFGVYAKRPLSGPLIMVTVHANWELAVAAHHALGVFEAIEVISLSHDDPEVDALFERMRNAAGGRSLLLDRAPLASLRALRAGKVLGIVADRDYTGSGVPLPFAGEPMLLPVGPAALAVQTGALIVPAFCVRRSPSRFAVIVGRPMRADPARPKNAEVERILRETAHTMLRFIGAAPSQWVAFHDAWASARQRSAAD